MVSKNTAAAAAVNKMAIAHPIRGGFGRLNCLPEEIRLEIIELVALNSLPSLALTSRDFSRLVGSSLRQIRQEIVVYLPFRLGIGDCQLLSLISHSPPRSRLIFALNYCCIRDVKDFISSRSGRLSLEGNRVTVGMFGLNKRLLRAVLSGDRNVIQNCLRRHGNREIDVPNANGTNPMVAAAARDFPEVIELLRKHGAQVSAVPRSRDPLGVAALCGSTRSVKALISAGANVKAEFACKQTALHMAARQGHFFTIKALLEAGADIEARDATLNTPLHLAAEGGHVSAVEVLLEAGADIEAKGFFNFTPLAKAGYAGKVFVVKALLKAGADVEAKSDSGASVFHLSTYSLGNTSVMSALLEAGADVNSTNNLGESPLHEAALYGRAPVVELLLKAGANVDAKDYSGRTPLHRAAVIGYTSIITLLLNAGANVDVVDYNNLTAYDVATHETPESPQYLSQQIQAQRASASQILLQASLVKLADAAASVGLLEDVQTFSEMDRPG